MERRVVIDQWQKVTEEDFNNFGHFPQESLDHVVADTIIPGAAFTGFAVVQSGQAEVTVGAGRLYRAGRVFFNGTEGGQPIDLLPYLPNVSRKMIPIVVWGDEQLTDTEPRTFLTNATTRATIARPTSTEMRRHAAIGGIFNGIPAPDPAPPSVGSNELVVAYVLVDATGIISITPVDANRAPSVQMLDARMNENDAWRTRTGNRLDTLATDISGLASRFQGTAQMSYVLELVRDNARIKESLSIPDVYTFWGADHFITNDESEVLHIDYLARVEEGIRFPPAATRDAQITLLNQYETGVVVQDYFALPAHNHVVRLSSVGNDAEQAISQYTYQTVTRVKKTKTRYKYRVGSWFTICTNWLWGAANYDAETHIFTRGDGELFEVHPEDVLLRHTHVGIRVRQVWIDGPAYDQWQDGVYWENVVNETAVNGAIIGNTFLNSQQGWLTGLDLYFTRVGNAGDVRVMICDVTTNNAPDITKVIGEAVLPVGNLKVWPAATRVPLVPTYVGAGRRYAIVLATGGNHFVAMTVGNKFAQGTFFYSTDGAFFQGDPARDMSFQLVYAQFISPRVEVNLQPVELAGGIANIDINMDVGLPPGTSVTHEFQIPGRGWVALEDMADEDPFPLTSNGLVSGLHPLLAHRVILNGTTDVMPGFGVGVASRIETHRARSDFRHISTIRTLPSGCDTIYLDVTLGAWRGNAHHTFVPKILTGGTYATVETHDAMVETPAPGRSDAIVRRYTFNLTGAVTSYRIRMEGTTDNVLTPFHVEERIDVAVP